MSKTEIEKAVDNNFNKDFTHKEVKELCKERKRDIKDFYKFMSGQTMSMEDGETIYFGRDVRKFFCGSASLNEVLTCIATKGENETDRN